MNRCIQLALLAEGFVAPNPMVGAVIVYDGKIIGEGYHQLFGESHAEVNAINSVKDKSLLSQSTIYVSLEPCAHIGKTPACANLLAEHNFKKVVIGCQDSFEKVEGKGIQRLKKAGIEVEIGVLEKECRNLNKRFFTFHEKKRPFVLLKWAESNGFIDNGLKKDGKVTWISSPELKPRIHSWRNQQQAILVGRKTVEADNPSLTTRAIKGKNPTRIIIDPSCKLTSNYNIFNTEAKTIVINSIKSEQTNKAHYIKVDDIHPASILETLYKEDIQSILIEGGAKTLQAFIDANLWDEAKIILGNTNFEIGTKAPQIKGKFTSEIAFKNTIKHYINE